MKRSRDSKLEGKHLLFFHRFLRMVENDDDDFSLYLNWQSVKTKLVRSGIKIENSTKKKIVMVPEEIECDCIYFGVSSSIGKSFIKSLRNALAHNLIVYDDDSKYFTIQDTIYRNPSRLKLNCKLTLEQLKTIESLITNKSKQKL